MEIDQGIGTVNASGSRSVSPATSTIYTLTVTDANGAQVTASAAVTVASMTDWIVETVAGDGTRGYGGDGGAAASAQFNLPSGVALDGSGNLYIADTENHRIRRVDADTGVITTVAGDGTGGYGGDGGAATSAKLFHPFRVAPDAAGHLYIADWNNHRIRKIDAGTGVITTVAGDGSGGYGGDGGAAGAAQLTSPSGVALDSAGNLYIADTFNHRIRMIETAGFAAGILSTGAITTIAGTGAEGYSGDGGQATAAQLNAPRGVAVDGSGNLYIADQVNHRIRKIDAVTGVITTVAGDGSGGYGGDGGPATAAQLADPSGVAVDGSGNVYIADWNNHRIRKIDAVTGVITTVAGDGTNAYGGDGGPAISAKFFNPYGVTVDAAGNLYIADQVNYRIRRVAPVTLTAAPLAIAGGGSATLTVITAANARSAVIEPGNLDVTLDSTGVGTVEVTPTETTTYTVTVILADNSTAVDTATVTVSDPPTAALSADPAAITAGQSAVLAVVSTNAVSAEIDQGVGAVTLDNTGAGSVTVSPTQTTTYTLTVTDANSVQAVATATVTVSAAPTATLSAAPETITAGQSAVLSVASTNAVSAEIDQGVGAVTLDNTGAGSVTVSPAATTTYTLTVTDANGFSVQATATVTVNDGPTLADPGTITTVAGPGDFGGDGGAAVAAWLRNPFGVAVDGSGNLYIADWSNQRIRKVDADGSISTVAGDGTEGYSGDGGAATAAQLSGPSGVAVDGSGNLYIADSGNQRIRKVDADGAITTVAGDGTEGYSGDGGAATAARLADPSGVAVDGSGNLYIADRSNRRIRKVDVDGAITTVAGDGTKGYSGDGGAATAAQLSGPSGVAVDGSGNLYIADWSNQRIRKVDADGVITTVAGDGTYGFGGDGGAATAAQLSSPSGVAVDGSGNLYIADRSNRRIRKVDADGVITTVAGDGTYGFGGDGGAATAARLRNPTGVAVDGSGNLYIADSFNHRIRKVDAATENISTAAGASSGGADGGPAIQARLTQPLGAAVDGSGNLYIADSFNQRIRKVDADGVITTVAGDGTYGYSGDGGAAAAAQLDFPQGVAVDGSGNLYIADSFNQRIRKVDADGAITTVAGDGTYGFGGDGGAATAAQLGSPYGVAVDGSGNLYIADSFNHRIRKVDTGGAITTVAGDGTEGYSGDGGAAAAAQLNFPQGVAVDGSGNLYIADQGNRRIRKVDADGAITTVAGTGSSGFGGDGGAATAAQLREPRSVAVDSAGNLYIADSFNNRIRKVDAATDRISTVAGDGTYGYGGDGGAATAAKLRFPQGVAVDGSGNLYIADQNNNRIRKVDFTATVTPGPTATLSAAPETITAGQSAVLSVASTNAVSAEIDQGVGAVTLDNTGAGSVSVSPAATTTYTLTVTDANGFSVQATATVTVTAAPTAAIAADPTAIARGQSTTLTWSSTNGVSAEIAPGIGAVNASGSVSVSPATSTIYTLTVTDANGAQAAASAAVTVATMSDWIVETVAGDGTRGYGGDGGAAASAQLHYPSGVALDGSGNLYLADYNNHRIRKVAAGTGVITTVAGDGTAAYSGDGGAAGAAQLNLPSGVALDGSGNLYVADSGNQRIRKVAAGTGVITTVAGDGTAGYSGDGGPATAAQLARISHQGVAKSR